MKIAFALIAHQNPKMIERLIRLIVDHGHVIAVHYDARASNAGFQVLAAAFAGNDAVRVVREFHVSWGQWSIVAATLRCLDEIEAADWQPDYVHLLSGADYPIRPLGEFAAFLERNSGKQFIECVPSNEQRWVRGGIQEERYLYRFYFNWRKQRGLFDFSLKLQKWLGLKRKFVRGIEPHMGSQWWTLTWDVLKQIMPLARQQDIFRFFRTTLIPDELFFQTMVAHLVNYRDIVGRNLTLYQFTDYSVPVVYYVDHIDYLLRQPFFFARKLSVHDPELYDGLEAAWRDDAKRCPRSISDEAFGLLGTEYENYRLSHRHGTPGVPIVGLTANHWLEDLGTLKIPYFCVLGTSTIELQLVQRALAHIPSLLCHGQLFHHDHSEFVDGIETFAGYRADCTQIIRVSAPNFLSDVIRSEPRRMSGFMLRWGQGWHIYEIMFDRPTVWVGVIDGDPLMSFVESLKPTHSRLSEPLDLAPLFDLPPETLVYHFRQFVLEYIGFRKKIEELMSKYRDAKHKDRVSYITLNAAPDPQHPQHLSAAPIPVEAAKPFLPLPLNTWMATLAADSVGDDPYMDGLLADIRQLEQHTRVVSDRLIACGISRAALDGLKERLDPNVILASV